MNDRMTKLVAFHRRLPTTVWVVVILAVIYGLWFAVSSPTGEFPLNDDWAYTHSVRQLVDTGELRISEWASATVIFQIYWGALFAKLADGLSFTTLRWSTLVLSFICCVALFDLLQSLGIPAPAALMGGLALVANPIFVYLSYTFMSDLFYFTPMLISLGFYVRGIQRDNSRALFVGSLFAAVAYLARQLGLVLPLAAITALILKERRTRWKLLLLAGVVPVLVIISHSVWLSYFHGLPWGFRLNAVQNSFKFLLTPAALPAMIWRILLGFLYLGVFTLPVLAAQVVSLRLGRSRLAQLAKIYGVWLTMLGTLVIAIVVLTGQPMPYLANVINREGIGTLTLAGSKTPVTPNWVFWLVTIVSPVIGAAQGTLWTDAFLNVRHESTQPGAVVLIAGVLMAGLTVSVIFMWDEYLIVFIPASLYLVLRLGSINLRGWLLGLSACLAMLAYSLIEMGDHMAWNAARWKAGERLMALGVPPQEIDGGFEWVGWYEFENALPVAIAHGDGDDLLAWMRITPDRYTLAFEPLDGNTVIDHISYCSPMIGCTGSIYVLQPTSP